MGVVYVPRALKEKLEPMGVHGRQYTNAYRDAPLYVREHKLTRR